MDQSANDSDSNSDSRSFCEGENDNNGTNTTEGIVGQATDSLPTEISRYNATIDPSPLTLPSESTQSERLTQIISVSAKRVEYNVTEAGVTVSVPVTTMVQRSHQSNMTYQDGYDSDYSDGVIGPFYDVVADQLADDDEQFDDVEHEGVGEVVEPSNKPVQETEATQRTYPPNFIPRETLQTFTNARIQEEL